MQFSKSDGLNEKLPVRIALKLTCYKYSKLQRPLRAQHWKRSCLEALIHCKPPWRTIITKCIQQRYRALTSLRRCQNFANFRPHVRITNTMSRPPLWSSEANFPGLFLGLKIHARYPSRPSAVEVWYRWVCSWYSPAAETLFANWDAWGVLRFPPRRTMDTQCPGVIGWSSSYRVVLSGLIVHSTLVMSIASGVVAVRVRNGGPRAVFVWRRPALGYWVSGAPFPASLNGHHAYLLANPLGNPIKPEMVIFLSFAIQTSAAPKVVTIKLHELRTINYLLNTLINIMSF